MESAGLEPKQRSFAARFELPRGIGLRFEAEREQLFRESQDFRYTILRVIFYAVCSISWLAGPWLNHAVFKVESEYLNKILLIELAWAAPVLALAAIVPLLTANRNWTYPCNVAGTMTLWFSVLAMHTLAQLGLLEYPIHMVNIAVMAIAFFGGFRLTLMLLGSTATMACGVLVVGLGEQGSYPFGLYLYETAYFWIIVVGGLFSFELLNRTSFIYREEITKLAETDALTGLMNRRAFERLYERAIGLAVRDKTPVVVALLDLDHFKKVNDQYGHAIGDEVLRRAGAVLKQWPCVKRPMDIVARYGGEEFVVVWFGAKPEAAELLVDRLLQALRSVQVTALPELPEIQLTASVGAMATVPTQEVAAEYFLQQADAALYQAKDQGRDRAVVLNP